MTLRPPAHTSVLLYSGGLDSYICAALFQPDVLLNVALGGAYGDVETARLKSPAGGLQPIVTVPLSLEQWEDPETLITPGRNAMLALIASNYGDRIWLGATAGDRSRDKDPEFAKRMNAVFEHMYGDQWWLPGGRSVYIELPIKDFTKRELVAMYLARGLDANALVNDTFSCYAPQLVPGRMLRSECGECKPCIRKWMALVLNDITPVIDASRATWLAIDEGMFDGRGEEKDDALEALRRVGFKRTD